MRKLISKLYTELQNIKGDNTIYIKDKWEKESYFELHNGKVHLHSAGKNLHGKV